MLSLLFSNQTPQPTAPNADLLTTPPKSLPTSRFLSHSLYNDSPVPLYLHADVHLSGRWYTVPPAKIDAHQSTSYSSCNSDNSIMTGTCGVVAFWLAHTNLYVGLFFSNPYLGSFKAGAKVYKQVPTHAQLKLDYNDHHVVVSAANTIECGPLSVQTCPAEDSYTPAQYIVKFVGTDRDSMLEPHMFPFEYPLPREYPLAVPRNKATSSFRLSLLSLNFACHNVSHVDLILLLDSFGRMAMSQYDVLCLHQVADLKVQQSLIMAGRKFHLDYCAVSSQPHPNLLILSRFPIDSTQFAYTGASGRSPGLICSKIMLPNGGTFHLVCLQLHPGPTPTIAKSGTESQDTMTTEPASIRYSQCIELASALQSMPQLTNNGCLIVGDFNVIGESMEYDRLLKSFKCMVGNGRATEAVDLFVEAEMLMSTWFPDQPLESQLEPPPSGIRSDFVLYLNSGEPMADVCESRFQVDVNKFVVDEGSVVDRLFEHDGLCVYME